MSKYIIMRTSVWSEEKPHPKAKRESLHYLDYRTVKTLKEAKQAHWYEQWFSCGSNHRAEKGMVVCDVPRSFWTLEVPDLEKFCEKHGQVIVSKSDCKEIPLELEIYDDYRE